jgi:hypothetical protein
MYMTHIHNKLAFLHNANIKKDLKDQRNEWLYCISRITLFLNFRAKLSEAKDKQLEDRSLSVVVPYFLANFLLDY